MTNEPVDGEHNAEIVPLHPDAPVVLPAVPAEPGQELEPARKPVPAIYQVIATEGDRKPIIPAALQRANVRASVASFAALQWHRSRYHGLRFPLYLLALLVWAVVGIVRVAARQIHWAWLLEQHALRSEAVAAGDAREWRALHKTGQEARKVRLIVLAVEVAAVIIAAAVLAAKGHWPEWTAACVLAVLPLARAGRPDGYRIVSPAVIPPQYEPPSQDTVTRALGSLGIGAINAAIKDGRGITFVSPVHRDGPGWAVQLDLPHGITAGHIIARRPELASGLRRPLSATWPEGVPAEHEGRLSLWVGFHDISKGKPPKHPLLKTGTCDVFAGVPFGADPRQRPVSAPLFEVNWLVGAAPGQGKTNVVRGLVCCVALDPAADLQVHELAGKGDLECAAQVCTRYVSGLDDDAIAYAADSARRLRAELERRSKLFRQLPKALKPEGKITRDLAVRYLGLRALVAVFDECQNLFMHPVLGAQAADDLAYVIRLGRALGIICILSTQRPDKDSLPTAIRGIVTCRFCLQVPDQDCNDMIMGTGAYKSGYNSVLFRPKTDAGMGWLKADGIPQIVRTYKLDPPDADKICARARAMRERAGVLSGYALGLDVEEMPARDVLGDLLAVFGTDSGMQWGAAADRLAERFPDRWADITAEALSAQCRSCGVASVDVRQGGQVLKGCRRVGVERAAQP